ncbi:MAG: biopolymer transporter ExbD, partial [Elusimicrobiota bacterium]
MAVSGVDSEEPITDINITPLVDVCLVLVIIFMVTAPLFSDPPI